MPSGQLVPVRHPFTMPVEADIPRLDSAPEKVMSRSYDVILNGYRARRRQHQDPHGRPSAQGLPGRGYSDAEIEELFGHMLEAFEYGAPPHGGIAFGIDRIVMILAGGWSARVRVGFG